MLSLSFTSFVCFPIAMTHPTFFINALSHIIIWNSHV